MDITPPPPNPAPRKKHWLAKLDLTNIFLILMGALGIGILGYRYLEGFSWIDSIMNASMIVSGMGPVNKVHGIGGKLFASAYAIFSGAFFLATFAVILEQFVQDKI